VLLTKLRRLYVERLHADLGHFRRSKTCVALARRAYYPGWHLLTGMLVHNCPTCNMCQRDNQKPRQANFKPMREFCPMAVIHADLVGPLPEGRNSKNQTGFQYILSVIDSPTRYLWLLHIRHKTAQCVAATLFDEAISRVSVPSAILMDQGCEFTREIVERLLRRLGISHLKTSVYHPQTDAKCKTVHFSVHNMITKMIIDKYERWPDLLGAVALAYNVTVHTTTGYSPHELFYSFAPSCPLDAIVSTPASDPTSNADESALQTFERLQEATAFVCEYTGKNMQRMKCYHDNLPKVNLTSGVRLLMLPWRQALTVQKLRAVQTQTQVGHCFTPQITKTVGRLIYLQPVALALPIHQNHHTKVQRLWLQRFSCRRIRLSGHSHVLSSYNSVLGITLAMPRLVCR